MQTFTVSPFILIGLFAAAGPATAQSDLCTRYPTEAESYTCQCPAGATSGSVWGDGPYTADSDICTAAVHAGVIDAAGGPVLAYLTPAQDIFPGSTQNGISTRDWGSYHAGFFFDAVEETGIPVCAAFPATGDSVTCACLEGAGTGPVWGSGPYAADSDICAAALHGAVIAPGGGIVTALRVIGLRSYRGSSFNGVSSSNLGAATASFVFDYNN